MLSLEVWHLTLRFALSGVGLATPVDLERRGSKATLEVVDPHRDDEVIEVIDSILKLHHTTPQDTEALEAPTPS